MESLIAAIVIFYLSIGFGTAIKYVDHMNIRLWAEFVFLLPFQVLALGIMVILKCRKSVAEEVLEKYPKLTSWKKTRVKISIACSSFFSFFKCLPLLSSIHAKVLIERKPKTKYYMLKTRNDFCKRYGSMICECP